MDSLDPLPNHPGPNPTSTVRLVLPLLLGLGLAGCGPAADKKASPASADSSTATAEPSAVSRRDAAAPPDRSEPAAADRPVKRKPKPLQLGGATDAARTEQTLATARNPDQAVERLQPFQVLLGRWRWVTQKKFGDFPKTGDDVQWIWDFRTDPAQPALQARSQTSPYFRELRLTPLGPEEYELRIQGEEGPPRVLRGGWQEGHEPRETPDGKLLQRTFKLQLGQIEPADGESWQVTLNLLDNDQYLLEFKRRGGAAGSFQQLDTVRQQRAGTSFAVVESDNPGPKCIVSGGLGTMTVSYQGKTYPVCCSGCSAAFNEDPERWLAKLKDRKPSEEKK